MKKQLYPEQVKHAAVLAAALEKHHSALDASSTGTGKTLIAAELAAAYKNPTLTICLKNSIPMWEAELAARGCNSIGVINYEMLRTGKTRWGNWSRAGLSKIFQFTIPDNAIIIWDEVQKCQGVDTQNSKMLIASKRYNSLLLSATAVENPVEMRALGYVLRIHDLRNFWQWCRERGCRPNQWKGLDFHDPTGAILDKLHHEIFPEHGSRLRVSDLKEHFKETLIITTPLDFGDEIKEIYAQMEAELAELETAKKSDSKHPAAQRLIARLRGRQKAELCKIPTIIERAEDLIKEGRSVVIFVNFNATLDALRSRWPGLEVIRGGQSTKERQRVMTGFQADTIRLIGANVNAGGTSINLHDLHGKHPRTVLLSPSDDAKAIIQALGRIHRAGGATATQQFVLFAAGTVEVAVKENCDTKLRNIDLFNDGKESVDQNPEIREDG